ncbi:MAG: hypothetical protein ACI9RO_000407 [Alteromonas macleodii]|jgi:hypothetical protein
MLKEVATDDLVTKFKVTKFNTSPTLFLYKKLVFMNTHP